MRKWCNYCKTDTHSDSKCWCTRAAPPTPIAVTVTWVPKAYAVLPTNKDRPSLAELREKLGDMRTPEVSGKVIK